MDNWAQNTDPRYRKNQNAITLTRFSGSDQAVPCNSVISKVVLFLWEMANSLPCIRTTVKSNKQDGLLAK